MPTFQPLQMLSASTTVLRQKVFTTAWFILLRSLVNSASVQLVLSGTGDPNGVWIAPLGSLYLNKSGGVGTTLYVKEADAGAATGWAAK